jgi:hypothetical protein
MSEPISQYKPTDRYVYAALNLYKARIDAIYSSIETNEHIEVYDEWYKSQIDDDEQVRLPNILQYPQCETSPFKNKTAGIFKKYKSTRLFLEIRLCKNLGDRIVAYTESMQDKPASELSSCYTSIERSFNDFRNRIDQYRKDLTSIKAQTLLAKTSVFLDGCTDLFNNRLSNSDCKEKFKKFISVPTFPNHILEQPCFIEGPKFRPSKHFWIVRAEYRMARIEELGAYLKHLQHIRPCLDWFRKQLLKETNRIDSLEDSATKCYIVLVDELGDCRDSLQRVQNKFEKRCEKRRFPKSKTHK